MPDVFTIRRAQLQEIADLRYAILRAGLPRNAADFPGDDDQATRHYAAWSTSDPSVLLACLSFMPSVWKTADNGSEAAWQLRGMAVAEQSQRTGVGRALVQFAQADLFETSPIKRHWCNARKHAAGFYEKLGWRIVSDEFDIPTAGPHYIMSYTNQV